MTDEELNGAIAALRDDSDDETEADPERLY
jgi:hypothetical protein